MPATVDTRVRSGPLTRRSRDLYARGCAIAPFGKQSKVQDGGMNVRQKERGRPSPYALAPHGDPLSVEHTH